MSGTKKASFISATLGCFVRGVARITKGVLSADNFFEDVGGAWGTIKSFFLAIFSVGRPLGVDGLIAASATILAMNIIVGLIAGLAIVAAIAILII